MDVNVCSSGLSVSRSDGEDVNRCGDLKSLFHATSADEHGVRRVVERGSVCAKRCIVENKMYHQK